MTDFRPMVNRIAFLGNYIPRQCGIATFTTDLSESISASYPGTTCFAIAMNDRESGYPYPARVRFELNEQDVLSYKVAAEYINLNDVDVLSLQHEYGIYGGPAGSHILHLLRDLRMPVVTTLHTVLNEPQPDQLHVLKEIAKLSSRLVVMSELGAQFLRDIYKIPAEKIDFIHHGIPDIPFVDPNYYKDHFGVEGQTVLLTFGLLSRNKGIENVIKAMPEINKDHPDLVYMVLGATHPNVVQKEGESYRRSLETLAAELGVSDHVIFENRFVDQDELNEYIGAADLYITPYLNPQQITSGTLAYAAGAGKAVISTPYWYAEELLGDGRGVIVPFSNPVAIAEQVNRLLSNDAERHAMRKRAYSHGREMIWSRVADRYMEVFERARKEPIVRLFPSAGTAPKKEYVNSLPILNLDHIRMLTDDCGLFQHAILTLPNYEEGYTTDDNARGLIAMVMAENNDLADHHELLDLETCYLAFLWFAFNQPEKRFRNFLGYNRIWKEEIGSEDSNGRALWSLGLVTARTHFDALQESASMLFSRALPAAFNFTHLRSWAFSLLGVDEYLKRFPGDRRAQSVRKTLSGRLMDAYLKHHRKNWLWFENQLTYSNARIAQALIVSGEGQNNKAMVEAGLEALAWLCRQQTSQDTGFFSPIGSNGWYAQEGEKARFDQQPIEACGMVAACAAAYRVTSDTEWLDEASRAFQWYLGANDLGLPLYSPETGGCQDGLHPDRVNKNQGAESSLSFLISLLEMQTISRGDETNGYDNRTLVTLPIHQGMSGR